MKKIIVIAVSVAAFLVGAVFVLPYLIPASYGLNYIETNVIAGADVRVAVEKIKFQLFPVPGYTIHNLELFSTKPPFQGQSVLKVAKMSGTFSISDLIGGRVVVSANMTGAVIDVNFSEGQNNVGPLAAPLLKPVMDGPFDITRIDASKSKINITRDGTLILVIDALAFAAAGANASAVRDVYLSGTLINPLRGASPVGSAGMAAAISGRIVPDIGKKEVAVRGLKVALANSHATVDATLNMSGAPYEYEAHIVSPDLQYQTISELISFASEKIFPFPSWEGALNAGATIKTNEDAMDVALSLDATAARFALGGVFFKGADTPFRASADIQILPESVDFRQVELDIAQDKIGIKGSVQRNDAGSVQINISGNELSSAVLNSFVPRLVLVSAIEGVDLTANLDGEIFSDAPTKVSGNFRASRLGIAGFDFSEAEGSFEKTEGGFSVSPFKANIGGAEAEDKSGAVLNGGVQVKFGDTVGITADATVEHLDAAKTKFLAGVVTGFASSSLRITTEGLDAAALGNNLKIVGTLNMPSANLNKTKILSKIFSADMWAMFEMLTQAKPKPEATAKLESVTADAKDLNISFDYSKGSLNLSSVAWKNPLYEIKLSALVDSLGEFRGSGELFIPKLIAAGLLPLPPVQKALLDAQGRFIIPLLLGGKLPEISVIEDQARLETFIKEKFKPKTPAAPAPAAPAKEAEAKPPPVKEEAKAALPAKKAPEQKAEDVLKVIIGK